MFLIFSFNFVTELSRFVQFSSLHSVQILIQENADDKNRAANNFNTSAETQLKLTTDCS